MAITEQEIKAVKEIILNGARTHFPPHRAIPRRQRRREAGC